MRHLVTGLCSFVLLYAVFGHASTWGAFRAHTLRQAGSPSILIERKAIPVGDAMVPIRLTATKFEVAGVLESEELRREWSGTVVVYHVSDLRPQSGLGWRFACTWPDVDRSTVLVDHDGRVAYFVASRGGQRVIVPIALSNAPQAVEEAMSSWFTSSLPDGSLLLNLARVVPDVRPFVPPPPRLLSATQGIFDAVEITAVARADDGTWSVALSLPYREEDMVLMGQGDAWRVPDGG